MSSRTFDTETHAELFAWSDDLDPDHYVWVTYEVGSSMDAASTAVAMAMEQTVATIRLPGAEMLPDLANYTARVRNVSSMGDHSSSSMSMYMLTTEVYRDSRDAPPRSYAVVEIGYPSHLMHGRVAQWLNVLVGEIPRLGFVFRLRVVDIAFGSENPGGPQFGVNGLRDGWGIERSPLLCRSTRPALGLSLAEMSRVNTSVLRGGFHVVKDDELQSWPTLEAYKAHVRAMVAARKRAEDGGAERKFYVANLLCEPWELPERLDVVMTEGADAVLLAPAIQGMSVLPWLKRQAALPLLAHNTFAEVLTRHPHWGISPAVYLRMQRLSGADWVVSTGGFGHPEQPADEAEALRRASYGACGAVRSSMLVLQGGKRPDELPQYARQVGSLDFMLIVASWVDNHEGGIEAGARNFREAVDQL